MSAKELLDIVVLDYYLSGGSAPDFIAGFVARKRVPKLIVTVKAHRVADALGAMVAKSLDVQEVFFKPFNVSELISSVMETRPLPHGRL